MPTIKAFFKGLAASVAMAAGLACAGTVTYYHNDLTGSPVVATNASGQVIWRESYRPYGERTVNSAAALDNKVWFTSRRQDEDTGLVYMGARYYDPVVGRFVSTDPALFDEKNLHSFNRYAYGNNNPYRYNDPDGKASAVLGLGAGVLLIGGFAALPPEGRVALAKGIGQAAQYTVYGQAAQLLSGLILSESNDKGGQSATSPTIDPSEVAGKTPQEIDALAREKGLQPKGPDPAGGKGAYVDPATGEQRILVHPTAKGGGHAHVNDPSGRRLDARGNVVPPESREAHLPVKLP